MEDNYQESVSVVPESEFTKYLVLSILELFCCCQITGIISLVFTILANTSYKDCKYDEYEKNIKNARTSLLVGLGLGIVVIIFTFFISLVFGFSLMSI